MEIPAAHKAQTSNGAAWLAMRRRRDKPAGPRAIAVLVGAALRVSAFLIVIIWAHPAVVFKVFVHDPSRSRGKIRANKERSPDRTVGRRSPWALHGDRRPTLRVKEHRKL